MSVICKGEVHYADGEGATQVEEVENFPFPVRGADEKLTDFQTRVTDVVLHNTRKWIGRKVLAVKWTGPLVITTDMLVFQHHTKLNVKNYLYFKL